MPQTPTESVEKDARCRASGCPAYGKHNKACAKCTGPVIWKDERGHKHGRPRSCHNCPMSGLGLPVCWHSCPGPNNDFTTDGQDIVTMGALEDPETFISSEIENGASSLDRNGDSVIDAMEDEPDDARHAYDRTITKTLTAEAETACRLLLSSIFSVEPMDLLMLYYTINGVGSADAAKNITEGILHDHSKVRTKISKQAVNKRLHRLATENTIIRAFIPHSVIEKMETLEDTVAMISNQPRTLKCVSQGELFGIEEMTRINVYSRRYNEDHRRRLTEFRMQRAGVFDTGYVQRDAPARASIAHCTPTEVDLSSNK